MASNIADFYASMREIMNSSLVQMGQAAKKTFNDLKDHVNDVVSGNNRLSQSYSDLKKKISESEKLIATSKRTDVIQKEVEKLKELNKLADQHPGKVADYKDSSKDKKGEKSGGGLMKSVADLFSSKNLLSLGKDILTKGMDQQKNIATLAPHLGKEGAAAAYANIKTDAVATPFNTDSLFEANKALIEAGASAQSARADTLALANAVSFAGGGNEQLTKMAELMGEVKKSGEASSEDLKKFADGGVDVYKALADATGTSVEKAKTMNVTYDQLSGALQKAGSAGGAFAGAMDQQNQTVAAKVGNFSDALEGGLANIGTAFLPVLGRLLDFGLKLINTLLPQIMQFIQPVVDIISSLPIESLLNDVMSVVSAILAAVGPILQNLKPLFDAIFDALQPLIQAVSEFVVILVQTLAPYLSAIAKIVSAILGPAIRIVGAILTWIITALGKAIQFIQPIMKGIADFISWLADKINSVMNLVGLGSKKDGKDAAGKAAGQLSPIPIPGTEHNTNVLATQAGAQKDKGLAAAGNMATSNASGNAKIPETGVAGKTAGDITSGGPRVININGVKFTDKIELHILNAKESVHELETTLQEMFLRILNSGAALQ